MATLIQALFGIWGYVLRAAPILVAGILAVASYFTALKAGVRLWDDSPVGSLTTPDYFVENFSWLRQRDNGKSRLELQGKMLTHLPSNDLITITPVNIRRQRTGTPPMTLQASNAQLDNMTGELQLTGQVHINRAAGAGRDMLDMRAPRMMFDTDREILYAYEDVSLRRGAQHLAAQQVTLNQLSGELSARTHVALSLPASKQQDSR